MKHKIKSFLTTPFVCLVLIISMFALPVSANAEAGTLGKETPDLSCVFTDSNGKNVDGGRLAPGKYTVDIVLKGMKAVSIVELTATYNTYVITSMDIKSTYADTHASMTKGGQKFGDNSVSVFQVAESDDASTIDKNGTVMVSLSVTVASSCDFADVFAFSTDPNLCFIEASYKDGYDDCYVLDTSVATSYKTYPMTADVSPFYEITEFDVNGIVTIATDLVGTETTIPAAGITVTAKKGNTVVKTTTTKQDGSYTFADIAAGDYTLTFSGASTVDRSVTLHVGMDYADYDQIDAKNVAICVVDYNKDGKINATDAALFSKVKADLDGDSICGSNDAAIFKTFLGQTVNYTQLNLN